MVYRGVEEEERSQKGEIRSFEEISSEVSHKLTEWLRELQNDPKTSQQYQWVSRALLTNIARDKFTIAQLEGRAITPEEIVEEVKQTIREGNRYEILRQYSHYKARPERRRS